MESALKEHKFAMDITIVPMVLMKIAAVQDHVGSVNQMSSNVVTESVSSRRGDEMVRTIAVITPTKRDVLLLHWDIHAGTTNSNAEMVNVFQRHSSATQLPIVMTDLTR